MSPSAPLGDRSPDWANVVRLVEHVAEAAERGLHLTVNELPKPLQSAIVIEAARNAGFVQLLALAPKHWGASPGMLVRQLSDFTGFNAVARRTTTVVGLAPDGAAFLARDARTEPSSSPGPARQREIVLLAEGAPPTERNIRIARTRTAYLEAGGNSAAALRALEGAGHKIGKSTYYDHLRALDDECPGWRRHLMISGEAGIPESTHTVRSRGKSRENGR